jgi:hypothetical protein
MRAHQFLAKLARERAAGRMVVAARGAYCKGPGHETSPLLALPMGGVRLAENSRPNVARCVFTRFPHTKLGGDKNMDGRRLNAGSPSEEDPRRTNDGHGQRALHSP